MSDMFIWAGTVCSHMYFRVITALCFTCSYEHARQEIDAIFGQKFHPSFPRVLKSCNADGCGYYPSTMAGAYNEGIDVVVSPLTSVPSPLSGYVQLLNTRFAL